MSSLRVVPLPSHAQSRILVTSDIHGNIERLNALLERVGFGGDDFLVVVGDLIEKGPHCLAVARRLMALCKQGRAIALQGNVDNRVMLTLDTLYRDKTGTKDVLDYLYYMRDWKGSSFFDDLCREATGDVPHTEKELLESLEPVYSCFGDVLNFLRTLPTVLKTDKYVFVHGGIPKDISLSLLQSDETKDCYPFLKLDRFLEHVRGQNRVFDRYVVCGHWPTALYSTGAPCMNAVFDRTHRVISIDGGCGIKRDGQLNMLVLPHISCDVTEITTLSDDGFETVTADHPQTASETSFTVRFTDSAVRVTALYDDCAEVEHVSTQKRLIVPLSFLYGFEPPLAVGTACGLGDYTDYRLPVQTGDKLSVVRKTSRGLYVKKDGVSGWYI